MKHVSVILLIFASIIITFFIKTRESKYSFLVPIHKSLSKFPINIWKDSLGSKYPTNKYEAVYNLRLKNCDSIYYYCDLPKVAEIKTLLGNSKVADYQREFSKYKKTEDNVFSNHGKSLFIFFSDGLTDFNIKDDVVKNIRIGSGYPLILKNNHCYKFVGVNYLQGQHIINDIYQIYPTNCQEH